MRLPGQRGKDGMKTPEEDPQYLKDYIKEHPSNKMAWYLLGREYAAKGQQGKANYCFKQAGEVYVAFEKGGVDPEDVQADAEAEIAAITAEVRKRRTRRRHRQIAAALALLLLLAAGAVPAHDSRMSADAAYAPPPSLAWAESMAAQPERAAEVGPQIVYALPLASGGPQQSSDKRARQTGSLLQRFHSDAGRKSMLLVEPLWDDNKQWLLWPEPVKPVVSVEKADIPSGARLTYYEAEVCRCEPADGADAAAQYGAWQREQMQQLVVRSALHSYSARFGAPPDGIEQMAADYPNNWLSGYTPYMKSYFEQLTRKDANGTRAVGGAGAESAGEEGKRTDQQTDGLAVADDKLGEPIKIMIDKTTHTLAVVSGDVLLRSYPVGLGGDRTPEGQFAITEKVRNPNGRDNGTFGSRGMVLSDTLYAIHGTNRPSSIGQDVSLGCIRMLKQDVEELFDLAPMGTVVEIGSGLPIPAGTQRAEEPMRLPAVADETNPNQIYRWLD